LLKRREGGRWTVDGGGGGGGWRRLFSFSSPFQKIKKKKERRERREKRDISIYILIFLLIFLYYGELHGPKTRKRENAKIDFRVSKLHRELQETRI
jgi:hypothetical protein